MSSAVKYFGVFKNAEHLSWAVNRLDKEALRLIVTAGTPLCEACLADHVRKHFTTTLDVLHAADQSCDVVIEDDEY